MAHSYVRSMFHGVFSTKDRRACISPDLQERLWAYVGGIARENSMKAMAVKGTQDHIHILLSLPSTISVAKAVQLIIGGSSKWVHETFPNQDDLAWQEGYGAFSVGVSQVQDTIAYIQWQETHHRKHSFQEEFLTFLKKHGMEYDERYVWG
jgi:REP-associated tyrosine transposase